ncbi:MAG: S8 family serine peptidase [Theionarchaea archaeon]|nr:S8 family serine peptidase [Theionarchaea archaeon]
MKMNRKVFVVVMGILAFSLVTVSAAPDKGTIHIQTYGYEGRDAVTLSVDITGEDSDYLFIAIDPQVLAVITKEINVEKLPFAKLDETKFKVLKENLIPAGTNEYVIVVPNDVTKMKWSIKDEISGMKSEEIVTVLVWFKEPQSFDVLDRYGQVSYKFLSDMGAVMDIRVSDIKALSEEVAIEFVEADEVRHTTLSQSVPLINADAVWEMGYDGSGTCICVIDTGIDPEHCDFPSGKIVAWADYINGLPAPYDDHGHGTHVSSIAAGAHTPYGVAPGASLIGAKVCNSAGSCPDSAIIMGIDFGVAKETDVENLSLGGPGGDGTSAIALECNWAVEQGVVVVCAAGNDGPAFYTINTPGDAKEVITVGACDKCNRLISFSSRGPTTDGRVKPDIVAPGVTIYAARAGTECSDWGMSGTSMATPHVAGVAALMLHANSSATPFQIKNCMGATALVKCIGKNALWGWGRVDAYAAVKQVMDNPSILPPPDAADIFSCSPPPAIVTIASPTDGSRIYSGETVTISAKTSESIDTVKFYLIWIEGDDEVTGELKCNDGCLPFACTWVTTGYSAGWYTIRAEGYNSGMLRDIDEITVEVRPSLMTDVSHFVATNLGKSLWAMLLAPLLLFGFTGVITRDRTATSRHKKALTLVLILVLSLCIPAALSSSDTLTVDYQFTLAPQNDCGSWMVEDTLVQEIAGEPLMPYRAARILLPQDTEVKDIKVRHGAPIIQKGIDIPWGQPPCTFSGPSPEKVGRNEETYTSNSPYPAELYEVTGTESFKGFSILNINLYPVQYQPLTQTVHFYSTLTVEVKFGKGAKNALYRGLQKDKEDVASLVDNPETVNTYSGPVPLTTEEYIIITRDDLVPIFNTLADHKSCYVNGTGVYTTTYIYATYPGVDNQEKIRNFIIDMYTNHGTEYVLLGGDVSVVPFRWFYVSGTYIAADMYYAHLDGTFDADADGIYAEPGEVDWYAEVAVGRAPVETVAEASNFVNKVIAYERAGKPKRVLLHQSRANASNNPDTRCLAYNCDDWIPWDYTVDYLFEEDGTVTKPLWRLYWGYNPVAVAHIGHGSSTSYYLNYNNGGNVTWYNSDISTLTNTFWPWHTTVACMTGDFTVNDCLAEEYVKDPDNGAIATYMNYSYGWYSYTDACQYSGEFCEMEFKACFTDGYQKLGDILNQARSYLVTSAQTNSTYRWCFYERNLIGDPESPCLTQRPRTTIVITSPLDSSTVYNNAPITITTTTGGYVSSVKFYLIWIDGGGVHGVLLCEDPLRPYTCTWDPTGYSTGVWYTIRADVYWCGRIQDVDEITVLLSTP